MSRTSYLLSLFLLISIPARSQHHHEEHNDNINVDAQPLMAQAIRIAEGLEFIGNPLPAETSSYLEELKTSPMSVKTVAKIQELLDPFCLAEVQINPESRVKVNPGLAKPVMIQEGWTSFLIKVHNEAHITARLEAESPNAIPLLHRSTSAHKMKEENYLSPGEVDNQFLEMAIYEGRPLSASLSGLELQYFVIQLYTKQTGQREVQLGFNVGQGSQDIGFRNTIDLLFDIRPAVKVLLNIRDHDGSPAMASFTFTDGIDPLKDAEEVDYRLTRAQSTHWKEGARQESYDLPEEQSLSGIYPLPARRLAAKDEYPDFFFQPQVYRYDGEHVFLPPGAYHVQYGRGPEYHDMYKKVIIPENTESHNLTFDLKRWVHMTELGWYSADHHIHAAGCSHYESPEEGVKPEDMWRQVLGEDLNMGNNLTWGPSWYYQKQFFTGENYELSDESNIMRYDVEVSGFPSSHAGHIVLLNLKEDDYPNTTVIEEWPSWTLPVLQWAKSQGGITGYAHSGWGLAPVTSTPDLPNYIMPKMDGIGANEYVVTVTHGAIDFYSAGDTPWPAELNMWYHTLNCGFTTRISGETDFPCISDERVGRARIYAKLDGGLEFDDYMEALVEGRSYVSEGHAHLIDFKVNNLELGQQESKLKLDRPQTVKIKAQTAAFLTPDQDRIGEIIGGLNEYQSPYWHIERSRIGKSRNVKVELIVNGEQVGEKVIEADGKWNEVTFDHQIEQSSWIALRIPGSAHTNPVFVEVAGEPIAIKKSAQWCRDAIDQCWEMKNGKFKPEEVEEAKEGYDYARKVYDEIIEKGN